MNRREFFQRLVPTVHPDVSQSEEEDISSGEAMQALFLQAMAAGLDPASYTPEALREKLAAYATLSKPQMNKA